MRSLSLVLVLVFVTACAASTGVEPTDLSEIRFGASRTKVQAILGEPVLRGQTEYGLAEAYTYNKGTNSTLPGSYGGCVGGCAMGNMVLLFLSPLAHESIVSGQRGRLTVIFDEKDRVRRIYYGKFSEVENLKSENSRRLVDIIFGPHTKEEPAKFGKVVTYKYEDGKNEYGRIHVTYNQKSTIEYIEVRPPDLMRHEQWACEEEQRREEDCKTYRTQMVDLSNRAMAGDPLAQYLMGKEGPDLHSKMRWFCLAGHNGNAAALYGLANLHHREPPFGLGDPVKAYQYFLLGKKVMAASADYLAPGIKDLPETMNEAQFLAAKSAVQNWKPDPKACGN